MHSKYLTNFNEYKNFKYSSNSMSKALDIEKPYNETTENYEKISIFFKQSGECYCNILNSAEKEKKFSNDEKMPGVNEAFNMATKQIELVFTNIDEAFKTYGKTLKLSEVFEQLFQNRNIYKEESGTLSNKYYEIKSGLIKDSAVLYVNVCEIIKKLNDIYRDSASSPASTDDNIIQPQNSHGSIFQNMNKMVVSSKISKLYSQYMHNISNYISYRESIKLCNQEIADYNQVHYANLDRIDITMFQSLLRVVFPKVCNSLNQLGQEIIEQANQFHSKIDQINFENDFKAFISNSNITFKDIKVPQFEPYNFTSPFAVPDQVYIQRHSINYFPVGTAVALSDFTPESPNEVPLVKGKSIYLMEKEARKGWILVMTMPLAKIGFVPFSYLKITSCDINLNQDQILNRKKK